MKSYKNVYNKLCSYKNLILAFKKTRKHKTLKTYVIEFEKNLKENLLTLQTELFLHSYKPKPLETFILRDPKTRKISKSDFRDRIVYHAICNIIEPIFDRSFIYDSYANRKDKGSIKALKRFDYFKRKVSRNNTRDAFILKADIKHYFEEVNHEILVKIIKKKIKDGNVIWLIKQILNNFNSKTKGVGMPLGNLTSQFFANAYLNELDYFIKYKLKVKYYIRYVDDFVILHNNRFLLECYKDNIKEFLNTVNLELHPNKSKIISLKKGINLLGFRVFYHYKLLNKRNIRKVKNNLSKLQYKLDGGNIDYDKVYTIFEGWLAYSKHANTYKLRKKLINHFELMFPNQVSSIEVNRLLKRFNQEYFSFR